MSPKPRHKEYTLDWNKVPDFETLKQILTTLNFTIVFDDSVDKFEDLLKYTKEG